LEELAHALVPGECTITIETAWRGNLSGKLLTMHTPDTGKLPHRGYEDLARERLAALRVVTVPPATGTGTVKCAHGEMPVPVPAVAELLRGKPCVLGGGSGERLTPTGAAILAEIADSFEPPGTFVSERIGYGAGMRDPKDGPPNILRVQLGHE